MRTAAKEVAGRKIRINTVHPGFVDSPMTLNILPEADLSLTEA